MKLKIIPLLLMYLTSCAVIPNMVMDQMNFINKMEIKHKNDGLIVDKYRNIAVIPNVQSIPNANINIGYQNTIYDKCTKALNKLGFNVIDCSLYMDYLQNPNYKLIYKHFRIWDAYTLDINKLKSDKHIENIGASVNANAIVAINILLNSAAPFSRRQELEMEVFIFDAKNAKAVWYGYANVTHGNAGPYKEKLLARVFKDLFKLMKEDEK